MRRLAPAVILLLACCGSDAPIPEHDLWIHVETTPDRVEAGRAFPLTIVRVWRRALEPEALDDDALAPLILREESTSRREADGRVEETIVFRAYAFQPGRYVVPGPSLVAHPKDGGETRVVRGNPVRMNVAPPLDPNDPGPIEYPEMLHPPVAWTPIVAIALTLLAATGLWLHARRRHEEEPIEEEEEAAEPEGPSPVEIALEALARVRARAAGSAEELLADHTTIAAIARDYLEAACDLGHPELTSEELLEKARHAEGLPTTARDRLRRILGTCDGVKFARRAPTGPERDRVVDEAIELVQETTPAGAP